ncbi:MAG TPA: phosphate uptake regulator PhoU [Methanocorpusculum sp.]|nr:phosphate uptake regulator PhoU [Methanocorpusculum sp.]
MEIRKVQVTGGASYVISLPKRWIRQQKIEKNDPVGVIARADGTLLLTPNLMYDNTIRIKEFSLKDYPVPDMLLRSLIGAYISGFTTIRVTSAGRIPPKVRQVVRKFTQMTVGQEVAEESDNSIVLKDILNPSELPFENSIRRMYVIVKTMHEDALYALEQRRRELAEDISARDTDVDRLHWLVHRQFSLVIANPALARRMEIGPSKAATYYQISQIIERVGDHAVAISEAALVMIEMQVEQTVVTRMIKAGEAAINIFNRSIRAIYADSIPEMNAIIEAAEKLRPEYLTLSTLTQKMKVKEAVALTKVANSLQKIGEYSSDIAEILINQMISLERK